MVAPKVHAIQSKVLELLTENNILFSVNFQSCLTLRRMLLDPRRSLQDVAQYISTDPVVSTAVLRVANSAKYAHRNVNSVYVAVNMIGGRTLNYIVFAVIQQQLVNIMPDSFRLLTEKLWGYSLEIAGSAYSIGSNRSSSIVADEVILLSMLLHLDTMFVMFAISKYGDLGNDSESFPALVKRLVLANRKGLLQTYDVPIELIDSLSVAYRTYTDVTYVEPLTAIEVLTLAIHSVEVPIEIRDLVPSITSVIALPEEYHTLKDSLIESLRPI